MFLARPTVHAPQTTVVHFVYNETNVLPLGSTALPGIQKATWIYITADPLETLTSQIVSTPVENPIWSQLGPLFGALEKPLEKIVLGAAATNGHDLILRVSSSVDLHFGRSSIVETDYISVPKRDALFHLVDANGKAADAAGAPITDPVYQQLTGNVTFTNTPKTWITANAAVGVLVGSVSGSQKMKVDNKLYASDPLTRGMAMAGVTLHAPYDASALEPTLQAVLGLFVGGVVSPTGGLAIGASIGWKGIAFTFGCAALFVQTAPDGKPTGASADGVNPQLVNGTSKAAFIGGSYAFK